jgi:K+-sensing histidine kinase KdpD
MKNIPDMVGEAGLKFFGKISASISHELKNALSIINESAGLLEDLTLMAQKGVPIDPGRLQTTAKRIQQQVGRADTIIQNMNRFGHSIDRLLLTVDLDELMGLLLAITRRISDMKGIKVSYEPGASPIMITTSPFFLKTVLWHVLDFAMGKVGDAKTVVLTVEKVQDKVEIRFSHLEALGAEHADGFPGASEAALISALDATVTIHAGSIALALPLGTGY